MAALVFGIIFICIILCIIVKVSLHQAFRNSKYLDECRKEDVFGQGVHANTTEVSNR